ncbi:methionyl-tRNA formyltransferase [Candidatus Campbellbacteria bacterium CG22_combo_CG10-13_8_21_14_all_36_13]|uniref:methionyl-tRNA formyltransferase n=1 Tax=Candidatus Campbellbacteria bacterium CG22_combo_CG10-13_8_21_14_all_36_13 TaxID=1974529 RepID=A0A2H0DYS9_9BACT|nr:MAG: methionyl-tRNA formyltransferase [Candidatus Campbellbacteria bacterium CG22_combo_CG10-13_8_21_14_all_36_13]
MKKEKEINFVFFGTDDFSVAVLDELERGGFTPSLIITAPDRPKGRGLIMTAPEAKIWAQTHNIDVIQPEKLNESFISKLLSLSSKLFIVASYGKIIPQSVLDIPEKGTLNVHPSLLPRWRGASPIEAQILNDDKDVGVTIMLVDDKMDHGPILSQTIVDVPYWPMRGSELQKLLALEGGKLLVETITDWIDKNIDEQEQDHEKATFSKKIKKEDALIDLKEDAYQNLLKIRAFDMWPRAYFFDEEGKRMIITDAEVKDEKLIIKRVIPEGKKEIDFPV